MTSLKNACQPRVKIMDVPVNVTPIDLSKEVEVSVQRINIPRNQCDSSNRYAIIDGFLSDQEATDFAWQWNGKTLFKTFKIKCLIQTDDATIAEHDSDRILNSNDTRTQFEQSKQYQKDYGFDNIDQESPSTHQLSTQQSHDDSHSSQQKPISRRTPCRYGDDCFGINCSYRHSSTWRVCKNGKQCNDFHCSANHPRSRRNKCAQGNACQKRECSYLHPKTLESPHDKSFEIGKYDTNNQSNCNITLSQQHLLKSVSTRMAEREVFRLPILSSRSMFCEQLKREKVVVVWGETGSDMISQLPQYAAESFPDSLVLCTQPSAITTMTLAHRVANEYDGTSVGNSVGYQIDSSNTMNRDVMGTNIMFMTDEAFIHQFQFDSTLSRTRVLIIDKAYERSLKTDIVMGVAKLLLSKRPTDFFLVLIVSNIIDPSGFIDFFGCTSRHRLNVTSREHPVSIENLPMPVDCPNDKLVEFYVIPSLLRLYPKYTGHTLVFLTGQREIEKALQLFHDHLPNGCAAFPLYESLSIEERDKVFKFDDENSNKRMIIFCSNVSEISFQIKNTRLVIDLGLIRQVRYDIKHRLNIIETVRISQFSAIERKAYAGKTGPGHCVRLYDDKELKEENIEPEIVRSSLDINFLQLISLHFDPKTFPFINKPDPVSVNVSLDLLTNLMCIDNKIKITERGKLFAELSLNPRFSALMINVYTGHDGQQLLSLAATIVAILSVPSSLFSRSQIIKEHKEAIDIRVATGVYDHDSDLLHLYTVFNRWKNVGIIDQIKNKCNTCHKPPKNQSNVCQSCREQHSIMNGLNNNILQIVETSVEFYMRTITNSHWKLTPGVNMPDKVLNQRDIIGKHLQQLFPEHVGHLLVSHLPAEGVRLIQSDLRANIADTSTYFQRIHDDIHQYFIAMTIVMLPSSKYIIDLLHPVSVQNLSTSPIRKLLTRENIGWVVNNELRNQFNSFRSESWAKWLVYEYDRLSCCLTIWGPETTDKSHLQFLQKSVEVNTRSKLIECGPIRASFQNGMICSGIESMENTLRLNLQRVPSKTYKQLQIWLQTKLNLNQFDIKENNFQERGIRNHTHNDQNDDDDDDDEEYQAPPFYIVLKSTEVFNKVVANLPRQYICSEEALALSTTGTHMHEKDAWGRLLVITIPRDHPTITDKQILERLTPYAVDCRQFGKTNLAKQFGIQLKNLSRDANESFIRQILHPVNPFQISLRQTHQDGTGSSSAYLFFTDDQQRKQAMTILQSNFCKKTISINVRHQTSQQLVRKQITPTVNELPSKDVVAQTFLVTVNNRQAALQLYKEIVPKIEPSWKIDSSATVTVLHPHLYPDFNVLVKQIATQFDTEVQQMPVEKRSHNVNTPIRCFFNHGTPQKTALAAGMLAQATSPIIIKITDDRQRHLFNELFEQGLMKEWSQKLNLQVEKDKSNKWIEIRGPQVQQGQLMRQIADYSDQFDKRFRVIELSSTVANFFGQEKTADIQLRLITDRWIQQKCIVEYVSKTDSIMIYANPHAAPSTIDICETVVKQLLSKLTFNGNDIRDKQICVFCGKESYSTKSFRICGHTYCRCASTYLMQTFPLQCNEKKCKINIDIQDLLEIFNEKDELFRICKKSLQIYLNNNSGKDDQLFCPNNMCDGLIKQSRGYQTCLTCGQDVCPSCSLIDDDLHQGRTCAERDTIQKMGDYFPTLFQAAEKFARDNWMPQLLPIIRIDNNMELIEQCPSLTRFSKGVEVLGHCPPPDMSRGFFTFHGTATAAIKPICTNGFDPKRRRGQVHGPGEYFGVTAAVSHGYCKPVNPQGPYTMIISFLLNCPQLKTSGGFCHVMNNPVDWSHAFSLPVVVVSYGSQGTCQSPFTD